ncbi:MAG: hypothetical protein AAFZ65_12850 [Planctomycetota bacterium]
MSEPGNPLTPLDDVLLDAAGAQAVNAPMRSIELAHLTGFEDLDALLLGGQHLHVVSSLNRFGAHTRVVDNVNCAAVIDTSAWLPAQMPGLIVAATGLTYERRIYNLNTGVFESIPSMAFVPGLHDASEMVAANLDNTGLEDLITLGPNRERVYGWKLDMVGTPAPLFAFNADGAAFDLEAVRTDTAEGGDPTPVDDVALVTKSGLHIFGHAGNVKHSATGSVVQEATLTVLETDDLSQPETLVYGRQLSSQSAWDLVLQTGANQAALGALRGDLLASPGLVNLDVTGLRSGDVDGDGDLDLLVSQRTLQAGFVLDNQPVAGAPYFDLTLGASSAFEYTDVAGAATVGPAPPAVLGDVNGDGRADLVAPFHELHALLIDDSRQRVFPTGGHPVVPLPAAGAIAYEEYGDVGPVGSPDHRFRVHFLVSLTEFDMANYTHVHVQVWDQPDGVNLDPDAKLNTLFEVGAATGGLTRDAFGVDLDLGVDYSTEWDGPRQMYLTYRFVNAATPPGGGVSINHASRWMGSGLQIKTPNDPNSTSYRDIWGDPYALSATDREVFEFDSGGPGVQGIVLGASVDVGRVSHLVGTPRSGALELTSDVFFWDPTAAGF